MHWNTSLLPGNPFVTLRRDFERKLGLDPVAGYGEMSIVEFPDRWVICVDVPGVRQSDLEVTFEEDTLVIAGERTLSTPEEAKENFNDRHAGKFRRVLRIREGIDRNSIDAELRDGVLTLTLKRLPEASPIKISVRSVSNGNPQS
ncbi:MAG: Hsp20/alpha crystallin family protein [Planctomycetota bacterium]